MIYTYCKHIVNTNHSRFHYHIVHELTNIFTSS